MAARFADAESSAGRRSEQRDIGEPAMLVIDIGMPGRDGHQRTRSQPSAPGKEDCAAELLSGPLPQPDYGQWLVGSMQAINVGDNTADGREAVQRRPEGVGKKVN